MKFNFRSSATGRFVTKQFAKVFPRKTVKEKVTTFEQEFANICSQFIVCSKDLNGPMDEKWQEYFVDVMSDIIARRNKS